MLKILDKNGKTKFIIKDDATEPIRVEEEEVEELEDEETNRTHRDEPGSDLQNS